MFRESRDYLHKDVFGKKMDMETFHAIFCPRCDDSDWNDLHREEHCHYYYVLD